MSTTNSTSSSGNQTENPWAWIAGAVALLGVGAWLDRNSWYAKLAPYGLTSEDTDSGYGSDPWGREVADTSYGTGHFHINAAGWVTIAILVVGLVAGLWCVFAAANVARWASSGGRRAVPKIPVPAAAVLAAVAAFVTVLVMVGRQSSPIGHMAVLVGGMLVAAAAWCAVMIYAMPPALRWRETQAFAGRADQVLGHGYPGVGRVRANDWKVSANGARRWPARLVCRTGPGWQDTPSEQAALNQYARRLGWPAYAWTYDLMEKQVTGTAAKAGG